MKAPALIGVLAVMLLLGCTQPGTGSQPPAPEPSGQAPPAPQLSEADVQDVEASLDEAAGAMNQLDSMDLEDTGITEDTFK